MGLYRGLADCHIHTHHSTDSEESAKVMVDTAIELGLEHICFTDHNDYNFPEAYGKDLFQLDFDSYYDEMFKLKCEYRNVIDIRIGVEQGLMKTCADKVNAFDQEGRLDYIIGSSHIVDNLDPYFPEFWDGFNPKERIEAYYLSIIDNIAVCKNYDVYGHLDYIVRYAPKSYTEYNWKDYYDYIKDIITKLIEQGKGIEINTAGIKYGLPEPNPCLDIIKFYHDCGGEIITTGSDAHKACHLAYAYERIVDILKACGFNYYTIFNKREPEFIKLSNV